MAGETLVVHSDNRKPRERKKGDQERKRERKRENERKERKIE